MSSVWSALTGPPILVTSGPAVGRTLGPYIMLITNHGANPVEPPRAGRLVASARLEDVCGRFRPVSGADFGIDVGYVLLDSVHAEVELTGDLLVAVAGS